MTETERNNNVMNPHFHIMVVVNHKNLGGAGLIFMTTNKSCTEINVQVRYFYMLTQTHFLAQNYNLLTKQKNKKKGGEQ